MKFFVVYRHMLANGRMYNPSAKKQKDFLAACSEYLPMPPWEGPIEIHLNFFFARPKTHFRTGKMSNVLKPNVPLLHTGRKDLDNLVKFVLDAMNKVAYLDDSQISVLRAAKYFTNENARVEVTLKRLDSFTAPS